MYYLLFFAYLFGGVVGTYFMEAGAFSLTFGYAGYENGVTKLYAIHALLTLLSFIVSAQYFKLIRFKSVELTYNVSASSRKIFMFLAAFFIVVWFVYGGIYVVLGQIDKTTFRISLGPFGALFYLMLKSLIPVFCSYLALLWLDGKYRFFSIQTASTFGALFLATLIALGAGFKALSILIMMPSFIFLFWRINLSLITASLSILGLLILTATLFAKGEVDVVDILSFIIERATVLQGDVTWLVWGFSEHKIAEFPIGNTVINFLGDSFLSRLVGGATWLDYNYGAALTVFIGRDPSEGFTVVGSSFLSAFLSFGKDFFFIYSIISGIIVSFLFHLMRACFYSRRYILAALLSTYNVFFVLSWIGTGDISKLFHISTIIYMVLPYIIIKHFISKKIVLKQRCKVSYDS